MCEPLLYGLLKSFEICLHTLPAKAADKHVTDAAVFSEHKSGWHHGGRTQGFEFQVKGNPCACQVCWSAVPGTGLSQILPAKAEQLQQIWAFLSGMLTMKPRNSLLHNPGSIAFLKLWLPVAFKWPVRMFHKKYLLVARWHLSLCWKFVLLISKYLENNFTDKKALLTLRYWDRISLILVFWKIKVPFPLPFPA